jgi:RNA polymerase sigma-70 factor (sigma-E family)
MRVDAEFEDFVRASSARLLRTAYLLVGDHGHAEDLLQTALLRTLRHWSRAHAAPEAYVRQVLLNLCRDRGRRMRRRPRETLFAAEPSMLPKVDGLAEQIGERYLLVQALAALPASQRHVIVLRFFEDLPVAQTAELLEISPGTVKSYTARALSALRAVLQDGPGDRKDAPDGRDIHTTEVSNAHR